MSEAEEYLAQGLMQDGGAKVTNLFRFLLVRAPREVGTDKIDIITDSVPEGGPPGPLDLTRGNELRGLGEGLVADGGTAGEIRRAVGLASEGGELDAEVVKAYQQDLATVGQAIARLKLKQERTPNLSADDLLDLRRRLDLVVRALQSGDVAAEIKPRPAALSHDVIAGAATNDPGEGSGEEDVNSTETDNRPPDAADRPRDGSDDLGPQGEQFGNKAWDAPDHSTHSRGNDGRSTTEDAEGNRASWWDSDLGATADQPADRDQAGGDTDGPAGNAAPVAGHRNCP